MDLFPHFVLRTEAGGYRYADVLPSGADGVHFLCPKCYIAHDRTREGVHAVLCWAPHVPAEVRPSPGRWKLVGLCLNDLTLDSREPGAPRSVQLTNGCGAHFHVISGIVTDEQNRPL